MYALLLARTIGRIALSPAVYRELTEVLGRRKFARAISDERRRHVLQLVSECADWFRPGEIVRDCRDDKDNMYLELAAASQASSIVSGDDDLLSLHPWRGIQIVRPARFLATQATA